MRVTLISESAYPYSRDGVSVWCDQLVNGLPDVAFDLVSLVATGAEPAVWQLPDNVASRTAIPLWEPPARHRRRSGRRARAQFRPLLWDLLRCLLSDRIEITGPRFGDVLRGLFEFAARENLSAALHSEDAVTILASAWSEQWSKVDRPGPNLLDAGTALQLLDRSLRPLRQPPHPADVVHCVSTGLAVLPALAANWTHGSAILIAEHGIHLRERYLAGRRGPYRWPVKALHLAFLRQLCGHAYREAAVIASGNGDTRRWAQKLGADPRTIRTVHSGIDPAAFPAIQGEPGEPTISWAGRIEPVKDLETLLRAFALVRRELPTSRLRLFGDPTPDTQDYLGHCRQLAADLGIDRAVTFEGRAARAPDAYAAGSVVALSAISEDSPRTLIEAMTSGRACVATDVGGVSEVMGDAGWLVPPRDPAAMAQACLALLRNAAMRRRLGTAARSRALTDFTLDRTINAFREIYAESAGGRALPAGVQIPDSRSKIDSDAGDQHGLPSTSVPS
ncbi:MAG: DUF3492 domain-containing protein [Pseudonocardia sp.]